MVCMVVMVALYSSSPPMLCKVLAVGAVLDPSVDEYLRCQPLGHLISEAFTGESEIGNILRQ